VADIRRAGRLTLGYQHHPDRAALVDYVALIGRAALVEDRSEIRDRWIEKWRVYFPGGPDDPDTIFVRLNVDRIELCVRGVTPEPFGSRHSVVERGAERSWKIVSD
jgi:general stress protein 26